MTTVQKAERVSAIERRLARLVFSLKEEGSGLVTYTTEVCWLVRDLRACIEDEGGR